MTRSGLPVSMPPDPNTRVATLDLFQKARATRMPMSSARPTFFPTMMSAGSTPPAAPVRTLPQHAKDHRA